MNYNCKLFKSPENANGICGLGIFPYLDRLVMNKMILKLIRLYRHWQFRHYGWFGRYTDWAEAKQHCNGYDDAAILQKVIQATRQVKDRDDIFERDGRITEEPSRSWPMLAQLLRIAAMNGNSLKVLDVGGSLGSVYFQHRALLGHIANLRWCVVEQPHYVEAGKKEIGNDILRFYPDAHTMIAAEGQPDVLLLSCVLPYVEDPYLFLNTLMQLKIPVLIVDDTYFNPASGDRLTIQKVPPIYYEASYPAWFLDHEKVKATVREHYTIETEYRNEQCLYLYGEKVDYRGFVSRLKIT